MVPRLKWMILQREILKKYVINKLKLISNQIIQNKT